MSRLGFEVSKISSTSKVTLKLHLINIFSPFDIDVRSCYYFVLCLLGFYDFKMELLSIGFLIRLVSLFLTVFLRSLPHILVHLT